MESRLPLLRSWTRFPADVDHRADSRTGGRQNRIPLPIPFTAKNNLRSHESSGSKRCDIVPGSTEPLREIPRVHRHCRDLCNGMLNAIRIIRALPATGPTVTFTRHIRNLTPAAPIAAVGKVRDRVP